MQTFRLALVALIVLSGYNCIWAQQYQTPGSTNTSAGVGGALATSAKRFAVAAANPLATAAGYQMLRDGGSAVDAAIAVQMVLTLVEPQSSGIGGGAFMLHFNGSAVEAFDGRETAPAAASEGLFLEADGKTMAFYDAVVGGRAVGAPGTVRMLEMAHRQYGVLPWAALMAPAIDLAENGFKVSPRLHAMLKAEVHLKKDPTAAAYFYQADGTPLETGHLLRNPDLAALLRKIASQGSAAVLKGDVARAIVNKVRQHPSNPGLLSVSDLAGYQALKRAALCHDYSARGKHYRICGFPPPSSGAIAVGQILGLLNQTQAAALPLENGLPSAQWLHLYTEAARLAFADRAQYLGDPDFVSSPAGGWAGLLGPAYLAERAKLIAQGPNEPSMKTAKPGLPAGAKTVYAPMAEQAEYGTSHVSIVDGKGHSVAMTSTIEDAFGARQMVQSTAGLAGGFLLNNQLTDFSFAPRDGDGNPIANRVEPGKRPRSSMAPTMVFDKATDELLISAGSPGGALIIHFVSKTIYGLLNWGLTPQESIALPNFASLNGPTVLEEERFPAATLEALNARGHEVREANMTSGLQAMARTQAEGQPSWLGGADPRREGLVLGD